MTFTIDQSQYRKLLAEIAPVAIETEEDDDRTLEVVERLTFTQDPTLEERALYKLLVVLIKAYEAEYYPMEPSAPHEILQHLIEASGTRQANLVGIIGSSGVVSERSRQWQANYQ